MTENNQSLVGQPNLNTKMIVTVVVIAFIGFFALQKSGLFLPSSSGQQSVELQQQLANMQAKLDELNTANQLRDEEFRVAADKMSKAQFLAKTAKAKIDALATEQSKFDEQVETIRRSERGRRIAADEQLVVSFIALLDKEKPTVEQLDHLSQRLQHLTEPLTEAFEVGATYSPNPSLLQEIEKIRSDAKQHLQLYTSLNSQLTTLVGQAPSEESPHSLDVAINKVNEKWAIAETEATTVAYNRAKEVGIQQVAQAKAELEKIQAATEAERIRQQAETEQQLLKEKTRRHEAQLAFEHDLADIKRFLKPAITPGYQQINSRYSRKPSVERQPVSYSGLASTGALERSFEGFMTLCRALSQNNDRPLGIFPEYSSHVLEKDTHKLETVKRAQELLIKHYELMIEKGLLIE